MANLLIFDLPNHDIDFAATMGTEDDSRVDQRVGLAGSNHDQGEVGRSSFLDDENFLVNVCNRGFLFWCFNRGTIIENEHQFTHSIARTRCRSA